VARTTVDESGRLRALVANGCRPRRRRPGETLVIETTRAGSTGSSGTCSTTPASTRRGRGARVRFGGRWRTIVIAVEDHGPGTATGDLEGLFERFAKADPARSGGSGLGLAMPANMPSCSAGA